MTTTDETTTGTPAETMRRAAADMRNFASDEPWIAATADLLDEIARQYDAPPCDSPAGVCNGCERREDFNDAERLARVYLGETAAAGEAK